MLRNANVIDKPKFERGCHNLKQERLFRQHATREKHRLSSEQAHIRLNQVQCAPHRPRVGKLRLLVSLQWSRVLRRLFSRVTWVSLIFRKHH